MRILIATNNSGKLREFRELLGDRAEILSMKDAGLDSPPETGATFEENAEAKARTAADTTGIVAIADDSGLEVDALDGAPGVYSARFSGEGATDAGNRSLLLQRLDGVPAEKRGARFVSVVAVCLPEGPCRLFRGIWDGRVAFAEKGKNGFGYDALFEIADGRTAAEISPAEKNVQSHRAKALRDALPYVQSLTTQVANEQVKDRS